MIAFVLRRIIGMIAVLFAVSVLTFVIFNVIPNGDPAIRMAGKNPTVTQVAGIRRDWDFDKPLPDQYVKMMQKVFSGDLISYAQRDNVTDRIKQGLPKTIFLAVGAAFFMLIGGIALGALSALRPNSVADRVINAFAVTGISMPVVCLGAITSYYLGSKLHIFPAGGYVTIAQGGVGQWLYHLLLPCLVLAVLFIGIYSRVLRGDLVDALRSDHVRTARAKGLPERQVLIHHALRTALIPMVTLWGLDVGLLLGGGAVLTESVFDLNGVGAYFAQSIASLDVPPVLEITLFGATVIVVLNTFIDILYAFLDPRIRL
ncbi:MAG: ABC transporter permease [Patulibacter sp.]|nr:ABC transporter permease [Patulibacter sp.]